MAISRGWLTRAPCPELLGVAADADGLARLDRSDLDRCLEESRHGETATTLL